MRKPGLERATQAQAQATIASIFQGLKGRDIPRLQRYARRASLTARREFSGNADLGPRAKRLAAGCHITGFQPFEPAERDAPALTMACAPALCPRTFEPEL